jgi:DNA-binding XRE family transcriptional regulator
LTTDSGNPCFVRLQEKDSSPAFLLRCIACSPEQKSVLQVLFAYISRQKLTPRLLTIVGMGGKGLLAAFGQVIKEARLDAKLSQEELGFSAGLNRNYVADIEKGRRKPSLITIFSLAKGLGLSPGVLMTRTENHLR